jgi:hypothetical protein
VAKKNGKASAIKKKKIASGQKGVLTPVAI